MFEASDAAHSILEAMRAQRPVNLHACCKRLCLEALPILWRAFKLGLLFKCVDVQRRCWEARCCQVPRGRNNNLSN